MYNQNKGGVIHVLGMLWVLGLCSPDLSRVFLASKKNKKLKNYIYIIQKKLFKKKFNFFSQKNENVEKDVPLMSMLHNKIKLEIDINNDEVLKTA